MNIKEMKSKGFKNYSKEELLEAAAIVRASKDTLNNYSKEIDEVLKDKLSVGEVISTSYLGNSYTATLKEAQSYGFNCDDEELYSLASKYANGYCKTVVSKEEILKDFKKSALHPELAKTIVINSEEQFKISKKAKKEED